MLSSEIQNSTVTPQPPPVSSSAGLMILFKFLGEWLKYLNLYLGVVVEWKQQWSECYRNKLSETRFIMKYVLTRNQTNHWHQIANGVVEYIAYTA